MITSLFYVYLQCVYITIFSYPRHVHMVICSYYYFCLLEICSHADMFTLLLPFYLYYDMYTSWSMLYICTRVLNSHQHALSSGLVSLPNVRNDILSKEI